ncbi:MAG: hypothetical protein HOH38_04865 [Nitrospinaceae bacterium]|nr:hypothetical protein [Nitrospina sp.]MBT5868151.1 hypothetical protein [Nitrospinaceae bacterium]MBT6346652.1 hypothetical protein [Nitrospina sp.]
MLIFKKNIYDNNPAEHSENVTQETLPPYDFIFKSLVNDREIFHGLQQLPQHEGQNHLKTLFPHASRFGSLTLINTFSQSLLEGLVDKNQWYSLNAYHMTYLFDSLHGTFEEYSYLETNLRKEMFPALEGEPINFDFFLDNYFFGTAFLMDADRYNNLSAEEKKHLQLNDSCLFGVVNRLIPDDEETRFTLSTETPYST